MGVGGTLSLPGWAWMGTVPHGETVLPRFFTYSISGPSNLGTEAGIGLAERERESVCVCVLHILYSR